MRADVAVVIVSYNSADQIVDCLESVFSQGSGIAQQVIVVDNCSSDNTVAIIRDQFSEVELVLPDKNLGFAAGVNLGVSHSNSDYVLLLNPDTIVLDGAVTKVVEFARKYPEHGLYGGRTLKPDGSLEPSSCWGMPSLWSMALFACGLTTLAPRNRWLDPESLGDWPRDTVREVGVITGCFLLVASQVWKDLGGFDERYFMYGEDVDLAMRAWKKGYRPVICPTARLIHEVGMSSKTPAHKMLLLYRGKASLVRTHWRGAGMHLGLFLLSMGTGLRALLSGLKNSGSSEGDHRWQELWRQRRLWLRGYDN